jgi:hypothetical protein
MLHPRQNAAAASGFPGRPQKSAVSPLPDFEYPHRDRAPGLTPEGQRTYALDSRAHVIPRGPAARCQHEFLVF